MNLTQFLAATGMPLLKVSQRAGAQYANLLEHVQAERGERKRKPMSIKLAERLAAVVDEKYPHARMTVPALIGLAVATATDTREAA
jgi:hypothetical protein